MKKTCMLSALLIGCGLCSTAQNPKDFRPMEDVNHVTDLTLDSLEKANTARPVPGSSRKGNHPVLFLVGNSTMRTGTKGNGDNGQWGLGVFRPRIFRRGQADRGKPCLGRHEQPHVLPQALA